jgi:hypothetical protein
MGMARVIKDLQDTVLVVSELERRQSVVLGGHSEWLQEHDKRLIEHQEWLDRQAAAQSEWLAEIRRLQNESVVFQKRTEQNLAEITDKLNGLIGYIDGMKH